MQLTALSGERHFSEKKHGAKEKRQHKKVNNVFAAP
jgi:hypothetical protein